MIPSKQELENGRKQGYRIYGYFWSFCELNRSCEECDALIRLGCCMKRTIELIQTKRILKICKPKDGGAGNGSGLCGWQRRASD